MTISLPDPVGLDRPAYRSLAEHISRSIAADHAFAMTDDVETKAVRVCTYGVSETDLEKGMMVVTRLLHSEPEPALLAI